MGACISCPIDPKVPPRCPCCDEIGPAAWRDMSEAQRSHWVLYVGELHCKPCVIQKRTGRKPETEKERLRKAKEALYPTVKKAPSLRTIDSGLSWEDSASFCEGWKPSKNLLHLLDVDATCTSSCHADIALPAHDLHEVAQAAVAAEPAARQQEQQAAASLHEQQQEQQQQTAHLQQPRALRGSAAGHEAAPCAAAAPAAAESEQGLGVEVLAAEWEEVQADTGGLPTPHYAGSDTSTCSSGSTALLEVAGWGCSGDGLHTDSANEEEWGALGGSPRSVFALGSARLHSALVAQQVEEKQHWQCCTHHDYACTPPAAAPVRVGAQE